MRMIKTFYDLPEELRDEALFMIVKIAQYKNLDVEYDPDKDQCWSGYNYETGRAFIRACSVNKVMEGLHDLESRG